MGNKTCNVGAGEDVVDGTTVYCERMEKMLAAESKRLRVASRVMLNADVAAPAIILELKPKAWAFFEFCPFCGARLVFQPKRPTPTGDLGARTRAIRAALTPEDRAAINEQLNQAIGNRSTFFLPRADCDLMNDLWRTISGANDHAEWERAALMFEGVIRGLSTEPTEIEREMTERGLTVHRISGAMAVTIVQGRGLRDVPGIDDLAPDTLEVVHVGSLHHRWCTQTVMIVGGMRRRSAKKGSST